MPQHLPTEHYQISDSDIENCLELVKSGSNKPRQDDIEALTLDLAKLTKSVVDASGSLPAFDQRQCEQVCARPDADARFIRSG